MLDLRIGCKVIMLHEIKQPIEDFSIEYFLLTKDHEANGS
jgi:hypothetical protein